jgi:hypothetical protein
VRRLGRNVPADFAKEDGGAVVLALAAPHVPSLTYDGVLLGETKKNTGSR